MLYQMMAHTEEVFRAAQLQVSPKAPEYLTRTVSIHRCAVLLSMPIYHFPQANLKRIRLSSTGL